MNIIHKKANGEQYETANHLVLHLGILFNEIEIKKKDRF